MFCTPCTSKPMSTSDSTMPMTVKLSLMSVSHSSLKLCRHIELLEPWVLRPFWAFHWRLFFWLIWSNWRLAFTHACTLFLMQICVGFNFYIRMGIIWSMVNRKWNELNFVKVSELIWDSRGWLLLNEMSILREWCLWKL